MRRLFKSSNRIIKTMQRQANLQDILKHTKSDVKEQMKQLYNQGDSDIVKTLQILSDSNFTFTQDFFDNMKIVAIADDAPTLLRQWLDYKVDEQLDEILDQLAYKVHTTKENEKEIRDSFTQEDKREFVDEYIEEQGQEAFKSQDVQSASLKSMTDIFKNPTLYSYLLNVVVQDDSIRNYLLNDSKFVDTIVDRLPLQDLRVKASDEVILKQSNQIVKELKQYYNVYQTPDGIVVMEK